MVSFLPDTSRGTNGDLTVDFGAYFPNAVLVLKRTVFDGMKQEEEEVTIEVKIQRLMEKTMAAATAPTPRTGEQIQENINEWKALGAKATTVEPTNYPYANCSSATELTAAGFNTGATAIGDDVCLISLETVNNDYSGTRTFPNVQEFGADLPSLKNGEYMFHDQTNLKTFTGKFPNITNASHMFYGCSGLTEWTVELPNSLTTASSMFNGCSGLSAFDIALPNSLENADGMFHGCGDLSDCSVSLPSSLVDGGDMFFYSEIPHLSIEDGLPNLVNGAGMFSRNCVYYEGPNLTSWDVDMPKLEDGHDMFRGCSHLGSFTAKIPSLQNADSMFLYCSGLTSFQSDMPSGLTTNAQSMFEGCKLDIESVERISRTIVECTGTFGPDMTIHLGVSSECHGDINYDYYINQIKNKGWIVVCTVNDTSHTH